MDDFTDIKSDCRLVRSDITLMIVITAIESLLVSKGIVTQEEIEFCKEYIEKQPPFCDMLKRVDDLENGVS